MHEEKPYPGKVQFTEGRPSTVGQVESPLTQVGEAVQGLYDLKGRLESMQVTLRELVYQMSGRSVPHPDSEVHPDDVEGDFPNLHIALGSISESVSRLEIYIQTLEGVYKRGEPR